VVPEYFNGSDILVGRIRYKTDGWTNPSPSDSHTSCWAEIRPMTSFTGCQVGNQD